MTKFCPKCGIELIDDAKFCGKCGTDLTVLKEIFKEEDNSSEEKITEKVKSKPENDIISNKESKQEGNSQSKFQIDKKIIIGLIAIIAIIAIAGVLFLGSGTQQNYQIKVTDSSLFGTLDPTYGDTFSYDLYGSINPMPKNSSEISVQTDFYDSEGNVVDSSVKTMSEIYSYSLTSNTSIPLGDYYTNSYVDMDHANIQLVDNGNVIANTTYKFNMKNMEIYDENFEVVKNYTPNK